MNTGLNEMPHAGPRDESFWGGTSDATFDEHRDAAGAVRPHWRLMSQRIESLGARGLQDQAESIDEFIRENGITFHTEITGDDTDRPWKLSAIPFLIDGAEWQPLHDGLVQRARLLQALLDDLLGKQHLIQEGVIPGELIWSNPAFNPAYLGLEQTSQKLHVTATDLVRDHNGNWRVTGDRTRAPSGLGYLLENRIVTGRVLPQMIRACNTQRLAGFFESLREHLRSLAQTHRENPRVALLTPPSGSYREFEDTYLARYLGLTLIQGSDLAVRGGELHLKTLGGLVPIQVLWRHISDRKCDPLELDPSSTEGVTGMLRCVRSRSVAVINSIGSVLAQTPGLMPYLNAVNEFFFGESLQLEPIRTYWCGDQEARRYVLDHLDELIVRPALAVSNAAPMAAERLSADKRETLIAQLKAKPYQFVAQEKLSFSTTPVWYDGKITPQRVALRNFQLITDEKVEVLPGALARVGVDELGLLRTPVSGLMTQDCWVTSDRPVDHQKSLLPTAGNKVQLRRVGDELPSRVAEHVYWLGRYAERAEGLARTLRTTLQRISGEDNWDALPEVGKLIYALASMGQIEPGFAVDSFVANMPEVEKILPASVLDRDQPRGLIRTMESVLHNATVVRDRLSLDAFRIIQRAYRELDRPTAFGGMVGETGPGQLNIGEAIERVGTLVVDLLALAGVTHESFVRTHAWQFLELGRRIERADQTSDLLETMLCPPTEDGRAICEAVLETTDSLMTYRSRYLNLMELAPVVDLIVTDSINPRSLRYQLDRIAELMDQLPSVEGPVGLDSIQRLVLDMQYRVTVADPHQLCQKGEDGSLDQLAELLRFVADQLPKLSEAIGARYLIHTEQMQQLTGTGR